jgi:hypothetical protein
VTGLDERFRLLSGGLRRGLERHQTLRSAVQWSYDLLTLPERAVLARASVFAGGFALEAAEALCSGGEVAAGDVLDILDSLVRKSLVTADRTADRVRYGLLETIRQFAEEQCVAMGEGQSLRHRHARHFAAESDVHFKIWLSPRQPAAYEWLEREMDNLRVAFRWAKDRGDVDVAARIASNVGDMARFRLRDEAANWAEEIVEAARNVEHRRLVVLLTWAASSAWSIGRLADAKRYGSEAIALSGDPRFDPFVWAYADLAMVASYEGGLAEAVRLIEAGAADPADRHDRFCLAMQLYFTAVGVGADAALKIADGIVAKVEATGVPSSICVAYWAKAEALTAVDPTAALAAYERGLSLARRTGNRIWEIVIVPKIALLYAQSGEPIAALRSAGQMLGEWRRANDLMLASHGLGSLIVLFERLDRPEAAATLNGMLSETLESSALVTELPDIVDRVRNTMGEAAFGEATRRGAVMSLHEATDYALEQITQALAAAAPAG